MSKRFILWLTLALSAGLLAPMVGAQNLQEYCQLQLLNEQHLPTGTSLVKHKSTELQLPTGQSRLRLQCNLNEPAVLSFSRDEIMAVSWQASQPGVKPLAASSPSYLLPIGQFYVDFDFTTHYSFTQQFSWKSLDRFLNDSLLNNLTMGGFYGLCLTLILYVFFMGHTLGDNRFRLYSLYVFCAATFFLLQEGQLNILLPQQNFLLSHQFYLLFAGLTVLSATVFIVRLTDLAAAWPGFTRYGLELAALIVLMMSVWMLFLDHSALSAFIGSAMAKITLLLMVVIFVLVSIQAKRNVQSARLVLLSLGLMVVAMVFRTVLNDLSPFLHRYALIFAFAIEAFMLAVAVSARIKNIRQDKLIAQAQANTDALCNVLNRRGWENKAQALLHDQRTKGGTLCLLYIDVNEFKSINDQWGHNAGDKVLKVIADIIRHHLRTRDVIGRMGGDEFVALGHFHKPSEAHSLAERIIQRLSALHLQVDADTAIDVSASVGYVIFDDVPDSIAQMLSRADEAMYQVKRAKKSPQAQQHRAC